MSKFFIPASEPEDWRKLLADPDKQWKTGFSAKSLAYCWQKTNDFPRSIKKIFKDSNSELFQNAKILLAFPEYEVPLKPFESHPSQNDIFILAKGNDQLISIAVEGKVDEPFGEIITDWKLRDRGGTKVRLNFLCEVLQLDENKINHIRYQLLHRTASAVIEAKRFNAANALMLVHSFSQTNEWFKDYCQFLALFDVKGAINSLVFAENIDGIDLYFAWVKGSKKYLEI